MTITQWLVTAGIVLNAVGLILHYVGHGKKIDAVGQKLESVGQRIEQNAPTIAKAVVATGLVTEVKQE